MFDGLMSLRRMPTEWAAARGVAIWETMRMRCSRGTWEICDSRIATCDCAAAGVALDLFGVGRGGERGEADGADLADLDRLGGALELVEAVGLPFELGGRSAVGRERERGVFADDQSGLVEDRAGHQDLVAQG